MDRVYLKSLMDVDINIINNYLFFKNEGLVRSHADRTAIAYSLLKINNIPCTEDINIFLKQIANNCLLHEIIERRVKKYWDIILKSKNVFKDDELIAFILYSENKDITPGLANTPHSISNLALKLMDICDNDKVLELCSGSGYTMVNFSVNTSMKFYKGIEINYENFDISVIRAEVLGEENSLMLGNALNFTDDKKYNKIFANYPFGMRDNIKKYCKEISSICGVPYESINFTSLEWLFNIKMLEHLEKDGKAICIMPNGALSNRSDKKIRKYFVENGYIEAVIALPERIFNNTSISTALVVLSTDNKRIRFVDASNEFEKYNKKSILTDSNISKIISETFLDSDISITKEIKELSNNDYILNPTNYTLRIPDIKSPVLFKDIIMNITRGSQITSKDLDSIKTNIETKYRLLSISNIDNGLIVFDDKTQFLREIPSKLDKYCIHKRVLVISKIATPSFKTAVVDTGEETTFLAHGNLFIIELDENKVDPYYIQAFFSSKLGISILNNIKSGTKLSSLSLDKLLKINIPLPDMETQKKIGNKYAAKMDEIIILKRRLEKARYSINQVFEEEGGNC